MLYASRPISVSRHRRKGVWVSGGGSDRLRVRRILGVRGRSSLSWHHRGGVVMIQSRYDRIRACFFRCDRAPRGWFCLLDRGHDGPCPAWPRWWRHPVLWLRMHRWEMSKGARLELAVAQSCGFGIVYYSSLWNR